MPGKPGAQQATIAENDTIPSAKLRLQGAGDVQLHADANVIGDVQWDDVQM